MTHTYYHINRNCLLSLRRSKFHMFYECFVIIHYYSSYFLFTEGQLLLIKPKLWIHVDLNPCTPKTLHQNLIINLQTCTGVQCSTTYNTVYKECFHTEVNAKIHCKMQTRPLHLGERNMIPRRDAWQTNYKVWEHNHRLSFLQTENQDQQLKFSATITSLHANNITILCIS